MAKVTLRGLTRRYEGSERPALSELDLDVEDGELLVLVGPSGCGKSTALRLVAGLDVPDGGRVLLGERDLTHVSPQDRDVAMVFQGYALYPHMRVRDIIAFPLKMRRVPPSRRDERVREVAKMLGLSKLLERRPGELSGGERQRVAMGRAIVRSPKVFLFDEPLSNLDAALRGELRVELAALLRRLGTTAIYVTHDQVEAMTMGDRIAVMRAGELQQVGTPREIYEAPANVFVAGFLGTPPMNLFELELDDGCARGAGLALPIPAGLELPPRVTVGVRPERVRVLAVAGEKSPERPAEPSAVTLEATVTATEPLGADTFAYFEADGVEVRARAEGFFTPRRGDPVTLGLCPSEVLWFDTDSGLLLSGGGGGEAGAG